MEQKNNSLFRVIEISNNYIEDYKKIGYIYLGKSENGNVIVGTTKITEKLMNVIFDVKKDELDNYLGNGWKVIANNKETFTIAYEWE